MEVDITFDDTVVSNLRFATTLLAIQGGLISAAQVGGGTFAAGTYYWVITTTTALGETTASNEASAVIALNGSALLTWNAIPGPVTGYKLYRGTAPGVENVLVATLGPGVTSFTDTNVGAAGTPPVTNTAEQQDYTLITGKCWYEGFSIAETSGTGAAFIEIQDNGGVIEEIRFLAGQSQARGPVTKNIPIDGFIRVHVVSGTVRGIVYSRIPSMC